MSMLDSLTLACFDRVRPPAVPVANSAGSVGSPHKRRGTSIARGESTPVSDSATPGVLIQSRAESLDGGSRRPSITK